MSKGSKRRPGDGYAEGYERIYGRKKFCYCEIGAGGEPCVSREHCDAKRQDMYEALDVDAEITKDEPND